ncbi:MAG: hypothetical protein ACOX86_06410 [Pelotomaculaceae bacterium]|jgi:hypothetical protein|uniref:Uncharacterized protein n=1 Tax=anaerobic digester metagenome TaxID=1263854 RepID=A0A485LYE2_9ZZZZ|nr:hypothetical protein [Bacillota bacterium]HHU87546.1 hypothetical protein [Peptococcaceae bacterium]
MKHTFLFLESTWTGKGTYYDQNGNPLNAIGQSEIVHLKNTWFINSSMSLSGENPVELKNDYEIMPFENDITSWKSVNPELGTLLGSFAIVEDSIISLFSSEKGEVFGSEILTQINESEYSAKGVLYNAAGKISSWSVQLIREQEI